MNTDDTFEKVKKLTEQWPSWKRDYQLTKFQPEISSKKELSKTSKTTKQK